MPWKAKRKGGSDRRRRACGRIDAEATDPGRRGEILLLRIKGKVDVAHRVDREPDWRVDYRVPARRNERHNNAARVYRADNVVPCVGNQQAAGGAEGDIVRAIEHRQRRGSAIARISSVAVGRASECCYDACAWGHDANASIAHIRNVQGAARVKGKTVWMIQRGESRGSTVATRSSWRTPIACRAAAAANDRRNVTSGIDTANAIVACVRDVRVIAAGNDGRWIAEPRRRRRAAVAAASPRTRTPR